MALQIGDNFSYQGRKFNFERDCFETKTDMKNFPETSIPPYGFRTFCKEDKKYYEFNIDNDINETIGKWREVVINQGSLDYNDLENKPQINNIELSGNKTLEDLGIQAKGEYVTDAPNDSSLYARKNNTWVKPNAIDVLMENYTIASENGDITTQDNVSTAIGKVDKRLTTAVYVDENGEDVPDLNINLILADRAIGDENGLNIKDNYALKNELSNKQDLLISGTNIKTINGESLLGEGNIVIQNEINSGTTNYNELENKPQINNIELTGNKSLEDLGIQAKGEVKWSEIKEAPSIPTKTSELENDSNFITMDKSFAGIKILTKAEYDELEPKVEGVLYIIVGG